MPARSYAFLRSRRWLGIIALALTVCVVCALLGRWQFHRYQGKARTVELVAANYESAPTPFADVVSSPRGRIDPDDEWRPLEVSGRFVGDPVVLPQRGVQGSAGDHVLGILELDAGQDDGRNEARYVVVDRGWHLVEDDAPRAAPTGPVEVTGRLRPAEPPSGRGIRDHQVFVINPEQVLAAAGLNDPGQAPRLVTAGYLMAMPGPATQNLESFPRPTEDLGNHLSYAFQWGVFSLGALVGLAILARREADLEAGAAPRVKRRSRDTEEEDALIDAQLSRLEPAEPGRSEPVEPEPDGTSGGTGA